MIKRKVEALATDEIHEPDHTQMAAILQDVKAVIDETPDRDQHQAIVDPRGDIGTVGGVESHTTQTHADTKS